MTLTATADLALVAFRRLFRGNHEWQRGDRALTLQMLRAVAPAFFQRHCLAAEFADALEQLDLLPTSFESGLDLDRAMSRLDALHLRKVNGLALRTFDSAELRAYIEVAETRHGWLPAWLMGEQAHSLGLEARRALPTRFPFQESSRLLHLYFVTHLFMVDTDYFYHAVLPSRFSAEIRELEEAIAWMVSQQRWDLLAEAEICLAACGAPNAAALDALALAQAPNGDWVELGQNTREAAHTTAACLIALAASVG